MIRDSARTRSGITLVEILISILIMGVGVISIATLFPLGLIRLRNAQRLTRSAYLVESATADLGSRNLMAQGTFYPNYYYQTATSGFFNPLYVDTSFYGNDWGGPPTPANSFTLPAGANRYLPGTAQVVGAGLTVAYDPLWWAIIGTSAGYSPYPAATTPECRFGSGIGFVRNDPTTPPVLPHAHGLQRVTNFQTVPSTTATIAQAAHNYLTVLGIFVSPEDVILQERTGTYADPNAPTNTLIDPSPVVPDMTNVQAGTASSPDLDWRYTWFFTGRQTDQSSNSVEGEIVICENRPFGVDTLDASKFPALGSYQVSGETVVEAVWGYSSSPGTMLSASQGYGSLSSSRSVLLRWPVGQPDLDVRVGGWIADVTYERVDATARSHYGVTFPGGAMTINGFFPSQRCIWYQVAKKSEVSDDPNVSGFRQMTVWTTTPLKAQTLLTFSAGLPSVAVHREAALIMPSVVNVYPRTIYTR